jgi:hypothetical protein
MHEIKDWVDRGVHLLDGLSIGSKEGDRLVRLRSGTLAIHWPCCRQLLEYQCYRSVMVSRRRSTRSPGCVDMKQSLIVLELICIGVLLK